MAKYKGCSNKPTWTLTIWLEINESLNNYWRHKTKILSENELSKELQTYFENRNPLLNEFTLYSNLLDDSLKLIDWKEVAKILKEKEDKQQDQ